MRLIKFRHKGLYQLYAEDSHKGVPASKAAKLRRVLTALETAENIQEVQLYPGWNLHPLKGDKKGYWSLLITGNFRLTFYYDHTTNTATDLELLDYH
jgi:proteic killer suppression protein